MKISIITIVLNNKAFITDVINSVLVQNYSDIEYIIIDGGSTDGSVEIIRSFEDKISTVISESDSGIYDAMNKGIQMARGEIIGFLHSDDFYSNDKVISEVMEKFDSETEAIYGDIDYVSSADKDKVTREWRSGKYSPDLFYKGWMPPHPAFFVRKSVYEKFGGYNINLKSSADYELMLRFLFINKIKVKYLPQVLVKMRTGGQSNRNLSNRIKAHFEDYHAWQVNGIRPRFYTLWLKPLRKLFQFRFW